MRTPETGTHTRARNDTVGEAIARFRRATHHSNTRSPWSQEELAFAIGTDQAHISRIESNQKHPHYPTLARICEALRLSRGERMYLFALAGYPEGARLPNQQEVGRVLTQMVPLLESYPYPTTLMDEVERLWHFNKVAVALWGPSFGISEQEDFLALARGKRYLELVLDPRIYATWKTYWDDVDGILDRLIATFWRAHHAHAVDREVISAFENLIRRPEFRQRWEAIERGEAQVLFVEYGHYLFHHPKLGPISYNSWRTHPVLDERFVVTHCTPIDSASARAFEFLARSVGRDRGKPGPI